MRGVLSFFLGLRAIMLIGSAGAMVGSLLMFLQGAVHLHDAWHKLISGTEAEKQVTVPVLEAVDAFLFGIVPVIFAYGIAIGIVFTLPEDYGRRLPNWRKVEGVGQLKATLAEVVIVVLIVIFARVVVEANGHFEWSMLVLPFSILLIAVALRMIELDGGKGSVEATVAEPAAKPGARGTH
jgi:uncharacterized membrane protein YqhA